MQCTIHLFSQMSHTNHHPLNNVGRTQLPFHWQFIFVWNVDWILMWAILSITTRCNLYGQGPLHTRDWEPMTNYLQALSLVEKAEPVQVHFTLRSRDQRSINVKARWMWSLHGFLRGIEWIMFRGHLVYFQKLPLGGKLNTKPGDHRTPNTEDCWFILFYHVWGPCMNINSLKWHSVEGPVTYNFTLHLRVRDQIT